MNQGFKRMPKYTKECKKPRLNKTITDFEDKTKTMASLIPGKAEMTKKLVSMGYRKAELIENCIMGKKGNILTGHEFHYSRYIPSEKSEGLSAVNYIEGNVNDGYVKNNLFASFLHFHFAANIEAAEYFINSSLSFKKNQEDLK